MDISNLYVPNVENWMKYYKDAGNGKSAAHVIHKNIKQRGGSITGHSAQFIMPIPSSSESPKSSKSELDVNLVSPVQQTVEQAKSEINRLDKRKRNFSTSRKRKTVKKVKKGNISKKGQLSSKRQRRHTSKKKQTVKRLRKLTGKNKKRQKTKQHHKKTKKLPSKQNQKFKAPWLQ